MWYQNVNRSKWITELFDIGIFIYSSANMQNCNDFESLTVKKKSYFRVVKWQEMPQDGPLWSQIRWDVPYHHDHRRKHPHHNHHQDVRLGEKISPPCQRANRTKLILNMTIKQNTKAKMWKLTQVCWTGWTETIYIWILHSAWKYFEDKQQKFVIFCALNLSLCTWMFW